MRIEIGGGVRSRGNGWVNVDQLPCADIQCDLSKYPWPIDDDIADEVYSSHCIEHVPYVSSFLNEIARIGKVGANVEIRCPHPLADLAMVDGHAHVFAPLCAVNMETYFPRDHWKGPKRLKLIREWAQSSIYLEQAKRELPFLQGLDDQTIMRWIPRTAHETVFIYQVVVNEYA